MKYTEKELLVAQRLYATNKYGATTIMRTLRIIFGKNYEYPGINQMLKMRGVKLRSKKETFRISAAERKRPEFASPFYHASIAREVYDKR